MDLDRTIRAPSSAIKNLSQHTTGGIPGRNRLRLEPPSIRGGLPTPPQPSQPAVPASTSRIPSSRIPARPAALVRPSTALKPPTQRVAAATATTTLSGAPISSATLTRSGCAPTIPLTSRLRPTGTATTIKKPKALNAAPGASSTGTTKSILYLGSNSNPSHNPNRNQEPNPNPIPNQNPNQSANLTPQPHSNSSIDPSISKSVEEIRALLEELLKFLQDQKD